VYTFDILPFNSARHKHFTCFINANTCSFSRIVPIQRINIDTDADDGNDAYAGYAITMSWSWKDEWTEGKAKFCSGNRDWVWLAELSPALRSQALLAERAGGHPIRGPKSLVPSLLVPLLACISHLSTVF